MNFYKIDGDDYITRYTGIDLTYALHEVSDFRMDYQIVKTNQMKKILKIRKNKKQYAKKLKNKNLKASHTSCF